MSKITKAALYARFSTDKQSKESAEDQLRVCTALAERNGWKVVARYKDPGISGGTPDRPGYQAMLAAAKRKEFHVIVAEDMSRLWREQSEQWRSLKEWQDLGIHLRTVSGIDSQQQGFSVIASVMGAVAEMARIEGSYRTRRGLESRALKGLSTGGRAYGYVAARDSETGDIEINEVDARIVQRIFKTYASGKSPRFIAAALNHDGIPSPGAEWNRKTRRKDGKWLQTTVRAILRNERYVGRVVWGRARWQRGAADSSKRTKHPGDSPIARDRKDRSIIDDKLWKAVQQRIKEAQPSAVAPARPHKHPLSGLLKCGQCDASFVIADSYTYACATYRDGGEDACSNALRVRRVDVERDIFEGIAEHLLNPAWLAEFSTWFQQRWTAGQKSRAAAATTNSKRLTALERQISNVTDAIVRGELGGSRSLAEKLRALEEEQDQLTRDQAPVSNVVILVPRLMERYSEMVKSLPAIARKDPDRARMLTRRLTGGIRLVPVKGELVAEFEVTGTRMALSAGAIPGPREIGGSGGRI